MFKRKIYDKLFEWKKETDGQRHSVFTYVYVFLAVTGNKFIINYNNQFLLRDYIQRILQNYQISNCVQLKIG